VEFKAVVVWLILNGRTEDALAKLAHHYRIEAPALKVGLPKGRRKNVLGCYVGRRKTIYVLDSDTLRQPFTILHEFYHHLRTKADLQHKGTEKYADEYAREFIRAYRSIPRDVNDK
jgi:hypothetical protein